MHENATKAFSVKRHNFSSLPEELKKKCFCAYVLDRFPFRLNKTINIFLISAEMQCKYFFGRPQKRSKHSSYCQLPTLPNIFKSNFGPFMRIYFKFQMFELNCILSRNLYQPKLHSSKCRILHLKPLCMLHWPALVPTQTGLQICHTRFSREQQKMPNCTTLKIPATTFQMESDEFMGSFLPMLADLKMASSATHTTQWIYCRPHKRAWGLVSRIIHGRS